MTNEGSPTGGSGHSAIAELKQLKEVETEGEAKLSALTKDGEAQIARLKASVEEDLRSARADAEKEREATVRRARSLAEREADVLVEEGKKASSAVKGLLPKELEGRREELLDTILGGFRPKGGSK